MVSVDFLDSDQGGNQNCHIGNEYNPEEAAVQREDLMTQISHHLALGLLRDLLGFISVPRVDLLLDDANLLAGKLFLRAVGVALV